MYEKKNIQLSRGAHKLLDLGRNNQMNKGWGKTISVTVKEGLSGYCGRQTKRNSVVPCHVLEKLAPW